MRSKKTCTDTSIFRANYSRKKQVQYKWKQKADESMGKSEALKNHENEIEPIVTLTINLSQMLHKKKLCFFCKIAHILFDISGNCVWWFDLLFRVRKFCWLLPFLVFAQWSKLWKKYCNFGKLDWSKLKINVLFWKFSNRSANRPAEWRIFFQKYWF